MPPSCGFQNCAQHDGRGAAQQRAQVLLGRPEGQAADRTMKAASTGMRKNDSWYCQKPTRLSRRMAVMPNICRNWSTKAETLLDVISSEAVQRTSESDTPRPNRTSPRRQ